MRLRGMQKDLADIVRSCESQGWAVEYTKGNHVRLLPPNGGGAVVTAATPSDRRGALNLKQQLRSRGWVDPTRPTKKTPPVRDVTAVRAIVEEVQATSPTFCPLPITITLHYVNRRSAPQPQGGPEMGKRTYQQYDYEYSPEEPPDPERTKFLPGGPGRVPIWPKVFEQIAATNPGEWVRMNQLRNEGNCSSIRRAALRYQERTGIKVEVTSRTIEKVEHRDTGKQQIRYAIYIRVTPPSDDGSVAELPTSNLGPSAAVHPLVNA